ncbi:ankyrin repeat and LEM domain-containing protein 2 [Glossina fuscipes fuscipes]
MPFYGLHVPVKNVGVASIAAAPSTATSASGSGVMSDGGNDTVDSPYVFRKKSDALEVLKKHKDARLKEFVSEDEAIKYAQTGYEVVQNKYNDNKASTISLEKAAFRLPTKHELIEFRKIIESGDCDRVKNIIWDNPRYLVSSGDTPTTLKEGYRYNAMHICAISKKPQVAELILKTVYDPKFVDLLTGKKGDQKMCEELCANLLDYYLNMPEKGRSETPLHLAAKYGCVEMVEVLTSYPECKLTKNSEDLLPKQIICSRLTNPNADVLKKIEMLLGERFYVPVLRSNDGCMPAQIGQPFSSNNPPKLNCDPLSPEVEVKAIAGPMSKEQANKFFRRLKTPPRNGSNITSPIASNFFISPMKSRPVNSTPCKTPKKSINNSLDSLTASVKGRSLFNVSDYNGCDKSFSLEDSLDYQKETGGKMNILQSTEDKETNVNFAVTGEANNNRKNLMGEDNQDNAYKSLYPGTPLLQKRKSAFFSYREPYVASPVVQELNNTQQNNSFMMNVSDVYNTPGFKERHIKNTDTEKGIECIGRELAKEQNIEWREYWDFLEEFVDIAGPIGLQKLENYLCQRQRNEDMSRRKTVNNTVVLDEVTNALEKCGFASGNVNKDDRFDKTDYENDLRGTKVESPMVSNPSTNHQMFTPYTYVEKSLQVHARRMTKTIMHNMDNVVSINDALLLELKRVKSLIYSFKEDLSFLNVNFEKVHSRIGNLVSIFLQNSQEVTEDVKNKILTILQSLLQTNGERREHMDCVCARVKYMLEIKVEQILPEHLKTEEMCSNIWSQEKDCDCHWESNLSRKTSRRNRMEARFKNHQRLKQYEANKQQQQLPLKQSPDHWRNVQSSNDSSDDMDEEVFWSDVGSDVDFDKENQESWHTPPESPSHIDMSDVEIKEAEHKIFIYGNEPTKPDMDVLNAILRIDVDKSKYPNVHSWKTALMRYPNDEMDFFASPRIVKKSHSFVNQTSYKNENTLETPPSRQRSQYALVRSQTSPLAVNSLKSSTDAIKESNLQLPTKRLFMSPKIITAASTVDNALNIITTKNAMNSIRDTITTVTTKIANETMTTGLLTVNTAASQPSRPLTPINKLRGLFSAYRERLSTSPLSTPLTEKSTSIIDNMNCAREKNSNDESGTPNLSRMNRSDMNACE